MTATAPSSPARPRGAGPLRRRDVRLLLAGQATSELGSQVGSIALPLVAVLGLGASPLRVGVLTAAGTISFAVGGLPAGVWVDRLPRRPVLVGVDLVRGLALATVPVAGALGRLTLAHLAVVALAVGMGRVLFDVAYPSYLPALVGRDELVGANAYLETSRSATQLTGPGLGGWLVQTADAATAVLADAVSFLASAGCLLAIRVARGADTARLIWLPVTVTALFALCTLLTAPGGGWPCSRSAWPSPPSARPSTTSPRSATGRRGARPSCSAA